MIRRTIFMAQERTGSTLLTSFLIGMPGECTEGFGWGEKKKTLTEFEYPVWLLTTPEKQCRFFYLFPGGHIIEDGIRKRPVVQTDEAYWFVPPSEIDPSWYSSFPEADWKFVYLFRDPRGRIESLCQRYKQRPNSTEEGAQLLFETYTKHAAVEIQSLEKIIPDPRFYLLEFEKFIKDPVNKLKDTFSYLGYGINREDYQRVADNYSPNTCFDDKGRGSFNRWSNWSNQKKDFFKKVAGEGLIKFGYERDFSW